MNVTINLNGKTLEHFTNLLNYAAHKNILAACCGVTDYLVYSFEKGEWRVYNEVFTVEDISEIVFRADGKIYIELEAK